MRAFRIYFLNTFRIYHTAMLTVVTMNWVTVVKTEKLPVKRKITTGYVTYKTVLLISMLSGNHAVTEKMAPK